MRVFVDGVKIRRQESFTMSVAPAADVRDMEIPQEWLEADGKPRQFNIEFKHGTAEVEDPIGRYLIDKGYAKKSPLILPSLPPEEPVAGLDPILGGDGG